MHEKTEQPKKKPNKIKWILFIILLIVIIPGLDQRMIIRNYQIDAESVTHPVRIVLITDLHSCKYGKNQQNLLSAIDEQHPDIIALGGDIFDDALPNENTETVIAEISEKYPCYYVTGNHECWCTSDGFSHDIEFLKACNVRVLSGEMEILEINQEKINLCGVDDPDGYGFFLTNAPTDKQLQTVDALCQNGNYSILLSHRPELFPDYCSLHFDLVLCGHAHGGQWRIPGILNGLYAPNQGFFPKYAGGRYEENGVIMIDSRGLARESTPVPRFYNRPELVVIDIS